MSGHWRDSMRSARFFNLDARAALPFAALLVHFRPYTAYAAVCITAMFFIAERYGLSVEAALRRLRSFIVGPYRPVVIWTANRRLTDQDWLVRRALAEEAAEARAAAEGAPAPGAAGASILVRLFKGRANKAA